MNAVMQLLRPIEVAFPRHHSVAADRVAVWHEASGLSYDQASELLDWLENQNVTERELKSQPNGKLLVRWFI